MLGSFVSNKLKSQPHTLRWKRPQRQWSDQEHECRSLAVSQMHPAPLKNLKMACSHSNLSPKAKLTSNQHLRPSPSLHAGVRLQKLCQATRFCGAVMESRARRGSKLSSKLESFTFFPAYTFTENLT